MFAVPRQRKVGSDGSFHLALSSPIELFDAESFMTGRNGRSMEQVISDDEDHIEIAIDKKLHIVETYLKLTESVKFKLIPADEAYLDKKTFEWKLDAYDEE